MTDPDLLPGKVAKTSRRFPVKLTDGRSRHEGQTVYKRAETVVSEMPQINNMAHDVEPRKQDVGTLLLTIEVLGRHVAERADGIAESGEYMLSKIDAL